jgi:hypothetical protein
LPPEKWRVRNPPYGYLGWHCIAAGKMAGKKPALLHNRARPKNPSVSVIANENLKLKAMADCGWGGLRGYQQGSVTGVATGELIVNFQKPYGAFPSGFVLYWNRAVTTESKYRDRGFQPGRQDCFHRKPNPVFRSANLICGTAHILKIGWYQIYSPYLNYQERQRAFIKILG